MDPTIILTAFIPVLTDVVKSVISKFTGNNPPIANADDYSKIVDADIRKLEALAKMDSPNGPTSVWVNDAKVLQRIVVVYMTVGAWITATFIISMPPETYKLISNMAGSIFFYLFGDRTNFYLKNRGKSS